MAEDIQLEGMLLHEVRARSSSFGPIPGSYPSIRQDGASVSEEPLSTDESMSPNESSMYNGSAFNDGSLAVDNHFLSENPSQEDNGSPEDSRSVKSNDTFYSIKSRLVHFPYPSSNASSSDLSNLSDDSTDLEAHANRLFDFANSYVHGHVTTVVVKPDTASEHGIILTPHQEGESFVFGVHGGTEKSKDPFHGLVSWTMKISDHRNGIMADQEGQLVTLDNLSLPIIKRIIGFMDPCTATCFGLTCRKYYGPYKCLFPQNISLWECCYEPAFRTTFTLGDLLQLWFGEKYRRRIWGVYSIVGEHGFKIPQYLNKAVYGETESRMDAALARRYKDYFHSEVKPAIPNQPLHILPSPFNKGKQWYEEARYAIKEHSGEFDIAPDWNWSAWMGFWMHFHVFGHLSYMEKLKVLAWFEELEKTEEGKKFGSILKLIALVVTLLRWISWWIGDLPMRAPFPRPSARQGKVTPISIV